MTVSEEEILDAIGVIARRARLVAEPSGAVATAAWLHHRAELGESVAPVAVVSGGNVEPALLAEALCSLIRGLCALRATGLSLPYVSQIRRGEKIPHPRHWHRFRATP